MQIFSITDELKRRPFPKKVQRKKKKCTSGVQKNCQNKKPEQEKMYRRLASQKRARTRQDAGGYGLAVQFARTVPRKYSISFRAVEK
jgi:hypothetical protein